ncbi:hypothetical protein [uncultured Ruminococcus sp.]|uniref:hypothetical protein n=1 Tax=uncultured Ruminococcus sp. TaxID=165186 RepID=UPI002608DB13|nr:hypothetical protein [uncultured Ruminococcus sp.]
MAKPSVGDINTRNIRKKAEQVSSLTEVPEDSPQTIFNLIFSEGGNKEMVKNEPRDKRN